MPAPRNRHAGFTLIELVMVVVLLGVVSVGMSSVIGASVSAYLDVARRDDVTQQGRYAVERITRELRNALPGSVRIGSAGGATAMQCLEFVPIIAASSYLDLPVTAAADSFDVVDFDFNPQTGILYNAAVFTAATSDVYGAAADSALRQISTVSAAAADTRTVSFTNPSRFPQDSPQRRVFIVAGPVSFCVQDNALSRHANYAPSVTQSLPPPNGVTLARSIRLQENGVAYSVFNYTPGALQRSATVQMDLRFVGKASEQEWVKFSHTVFLRNAP